MSTDYGNYASNGRSATKIGKILNRCESKVLNILQLVAEKHKMIVHAKQRIADIFPLYESGINSTLYKFAFVSRFDFLITQNNNPVMVIEFDGSGHPGPARVKYDRYKNQLCSVFRLPMLHADTQYLRVLGDSTILEYLVDLVLQRVQIPDSNALPNYPFEPACHSPHIANYRLPYDVKHISLSPKSFLNSLFRGSLHTWEASEFQNLTHFDCDEKITCSTRLVKTKDNFYIAVAFTILDDDTAILGSGAVYADPHSLLDEPFLAIALALIDTLDLLRMFDMERYPGLALKDAIEYLNHFQKYANDEGCGRFLNMSPLCQELTNDWLRSSPISSQSMAPG
ncbi:MAG TPA: DUF2726 domain-containing protein [Oculatellaceae cyanobacterium]